MVPPHGRHDLGDRAVVLVSVVDAGGEDQVDLPSLCRLLQQLLGLAPERGEAPVGKASRPDRDLVSRQEQLGAVAGLLESHGVARRDDELDREVRHRRCEPQQGAAAADLDVVGVSPERHDVQCPAGQVQHQRLHQLETITRWAGTSSTDGGADSFSPRRPHGPRARPVAVQLLEVAALLEGVHRRPEPEMGDREQLALPRPAGGTRDPPGPRPRARTSKSS